MKKIPIRLPADVLGAEISIPDQGVVWVHQSEPIGMIEQITKLENGNYIAIVDPDPLLEKYGLDVFDQLQFAAGGLIKERDKMEITKFELQQVSITFKH